MYADVIIEYGNKAVDTLFTYIIPDNLREKIPEDITEKINGANILSYRRIGKYIVIDLNNKLSLIWHLGMSGKIKTFADLPSQKEKHDHIVIETNHGTTKYETGLYDSDFMLMGTFIQSFIRRGGYWNDDFGSGVFYTNGTVGAADSTYGFRPVVIL